MRVPFLDLRRHWAAVADDVTRAAMDVLAEGPYILGPRLERFEQAFAEYCGVPHAVGVASGTEALHLTLQALGVGPGDEVITTPLTAAFTGLPVLALGARPVFADVDPRTYTVRPDAVEALIGPRTRAILPVHLHGRAAAVAELRAVAERAGVPLVEDACQAHGARVDGRSVGAWGVAGCFSFYPTKNLGGYGDGGMVVTADARLAEHVRLLRHGGQRQRAWHELPGTAGRLDELQAAMLHAKLPRLAEWTAARRHLARRYQERLAATPLLLPSIPDDQSHVFHLYVVRTPERDRLRAWLADLGIGTDIYYPHPLHLQPVFKHCGAAPGSLPDVEHACAEILALPCYPQLTEAELDAVCDGIGSFFARAGSWRR